MMFSYLEKLNLRHLRMIQGIGRMGSLSGASRKLFTSQPAVTHALAKFEDRLGIQIFKRTATGCYPTHQGKLYLLRIDRFLEILDNAISRVMSPVDGRICPMQHVDRLITGTQLRSLIALSDHQRTREYARDLGISPASLLRSVRRLEDALSTALIQRNSQGLVSNYKGNFLAGEFRRALREFELILQEPRHVVPDNCPEIVIGISSMAGSQLLAEATRQFMSSPVRVRFKFISGDYARLYSDLTNERIDMIFGTLHTDNDAAQISQEILFNDRYCVVASPEHPLARLEEVTPAEMSYFQWLVPPGGTPDRTHLDAIFDGLPTPPMINCETTSLSMIRQLLSGTDMLTLMVRSAVQYDLNCGILRELHCPFYDDTLLVGLTTRKNWQPSAAHFAFLDQLRSTPLQLTA